MYTALIRYYHCTTITQDGKSTLDLLYFVQYARQHTFFNAAKPGAPNFLARTFSIFCFVINNRQLTALARYFYCIGAELVLII